MKELSVDVDKMYVDISKIKQVFDNLLLNAAQSMPKGGKITISSKKAGENRIPAGKEGIEM